MTYHNDHLGTSQKMTDSSGTVVWSADYKPFGEATIAVSTIMNNLRFPGQYYDTETGLNYNYYRDYNPVLGRYISKDPIGFRGGINLYAYTRNNPVNRIDPLGLAEEFPTEPGVPFSPSKNTPSPSVYISYGGVLGIIEVTANTQSKTQTYVNAATPQLGGGISICFPSKAQNPSNKSCGKDTNPPTISIGSKYLGVTFATDSSVWCVNLGLAGSPLPINMSIPLWTINW